MGDINQRDTDESINDFMQGVINSAKKNDIPVPAVVALFGVFARSVVDTRTQNGTPHEVAMMEVISEFMHGLGVATVHVREDGQPLTTH